MQSEANRGPAGPSVFNRPPQPRSAATVAGGHTTPRGASSGFDGGAATRGTEPGVAGAGPTDEARAALEGQRRSGGQWFFWIAALSLVNTIVAFTGQEWRFIIGLGITELVHGIAEQSGGAGVKAGLVGLVVIGVFAFLGQRAVQGYGWAFVVGMALYGLDGAIFLLVQDWVGVGFHAFALTMMARGYLAARQLSPAHA
jgi:hypothetical protein